MSSIWGVICVVILYHLFNVPLWGVAGVITLSIHLVFMIIKLEFPSAAAIALLPTIIHLENLWFYQYKYCLVYLFSFYQA
ncbi:hypothetical protein [Alkalihalobacterium alkalinitrilicum]|uniref:hypothetical protein n=1 Tax=Alkalihalobacterium alkalinitrilicum TaxID=427920 RepID=UPI0013038970|nr:hypothetical protein [Alkalihalobacterium alkalinitrilicum]